MLTRRRFLIDSGASAALLASARFDLLASKEDLWSRTSAILRRITAPRFSRRDVEITAHGAKGDGTTDCSQAIRAAIDACRSGGGGRVVVPAGRFLTGAIRLRSNVNLHLSDGAVLAFLPDASAYLPLVLTRFEGTELMNYSPFIYALDETNVAITGHGTLDGQADQQHWWNWRANQAPARNRLIQMATEGVAPERRVFGDGPSRLRPNFIQPYRCTNVLIEDVTIVNSPMWEVHPVLCTNVIVRGVNIRSHGPNNDGCDPESCRDVLIEKCTFDTGDDCIALKSGRNEDGRRLHAPIENVVIRDCDMRDGHGGVVIGSEISGGARDIFAEKCRMDSPRLDRVLRFKNNAARGGLIERVAMRDVTVGEVAEAIVAADFFYEEGRNGRYKPVLRDVEVRNVTSRKSRYAFLLRGFADSPIADIRVIDCTFDGVQSPDVLEGVRDLVLTNVRINGQRRDERLNR
ncbi:MAG TPA: glycoside hydrolase family 28 protein [Vicinamibacterales bacterium]|nr:glycoside hydrolase family 28 protein [Vicinamibacterales bacterium]